MNTQQSDTIELGHVLRTISRGWRAIVAFTLFGLMVATAIILFGPRKFTGVGTVVLKPGSQAGASGIMSQVTGLGDVTSGLLGGKTSMETEIGVLSSRSVIGEVVDSLRLQARIRGRTPPPTLAIISNVNAPGSFRPRRYEFKRDSRGSYSFTGKDASGTMVKGTPLTLPVGTIMFAAGATLPQSFKFELRDRDDAIERASGKLVVDKEKGEVASIAYTGDDSLTAARVPNLVLETYLRRRRGIDRGVNQKRVEFLVAKSDSMERALSTAARDLRRQQESNGMLDATAVARVELESGALLRAKQTDIRVERGALQQLMAQINSRTITPRQLAAYPTFLKSPVVNNLVGSLADLESRRTAMLATRTETDREVVAINENIRHTEAQLIPYATTYATALEREEAAIQRSLDTQDATIARLPAAAESSTRLQRDVLDLARLSAGLQAQIVEAKLAAIGEGGDVRPLDAATIPKRPSFPHPPLTAGIGLVGGLFMGLIAALLVGSVGRWVRDPIEVERTTGVRAIEFDPAVPLLLSNAVSRTVVVAPLEPGADVAAVVTRLAQTATSRSLNAVVLNLSALAPDINGTIARLEGQHDLVIVQLPSLISDSAVATLQPGRPVFLVTTGPRTERRRVMAAVEMLKRIDVVCAGIVMSAAVGPSALKSGNG